ncbi:copper resistance system multicopper oxidase [Neopusillimonas aromaticivorans]|uniref:copper resistance system multicopper oxidase n=1 Tax=Neopusillimonas aromaticivorans TaxID=2979868 RepID=UPI0025987F51|nr:copper resistance system multicopper oxidase [Neopusillimonas aromaticivorans]WJJ93238.1 copper resistance system multicopper oxidase [Neopusillimonas aromaticivorans]
MPRRRFVQGLAAGGVMLGLSPFAHAAGIVSSQARTGTAPLLTGTEFNLEVGQSPVNFTGNPRMAFTINGSVPAPTLRWREGDTVTIRVKNTLKEDTSIHWHGIILPYQMDGVPGISFPGIPPGETFVYQFKLEQSGTYWYHSHSGMQEAQGMYGAIIVEPRDADPIRVDRDHIIQLSDWTDEHPMRVLSKLKAQGDYYNYNKPTVVDFYRDVSKMGMSAALEKRQMWNEMRMSPTDLADLSADVLTYLMNGTTPAGNWTGLFRPGERVRLRFVNGAANTFYDVRIPGLKMTVVQADGQNVEPVTVDEFRFGPGQTYDVVVQPKDDAYTVFAQSMDRTGYARGTLAVREGLTAPVPDLDPVQWLTMTDMMGDMGGMDHGAMGHGAMNHGAAGSAAMNHSGMNHGGMNHAAMGHGSAASAGPSKTVLHARTEYGPSVDMRVDTPRTNLDDPGIGLRDNGRRVLNLADLHTVGGPMDPRGAEREIELHLTGHMERYSWSFDGVEFGQSTPVHFRYGERVRVILHNDTMMTHPMHLHGVWSELETPDGAFQARLHTIPVQPAQRISFLVTADALGRWAWHCHLMFHMDMGMFREVVIA